MQPRLTTQITVNAGSIALTGDLTIPADAAAIIVFAHGSGSGRKSPRNQFVADSMVADGFATLLFDLLTEDEELAERATRHLRFDIPLLAERLVGALEWVRTQALIRTLPIGLFGASTGAAAALIASTRVESVGAIVSRGGRPDLAYPVLPRVVAPTLLIVGARDPEVLELNRIALRNMTTLARLHIVPGATHLFEEPGALEQVTEISASWFRTHLVRAPKTQHAAHP